MPGEARWPALEPYVDSWRPATASGELWDTGLGFPCVRFDAGAGGGAVPGVIVVLRPARSAEALAVLDRIEDEGRLYRRVVVTTSAGEAYAYEWLGATDGFSPLPDGWPRR